MSLVYDVYLVDPSVQPSPPIDTTRLSTHEQAAVFLRSLMPLRQAKPSRPMVALVTKLHETHPGDLGVLAGEQSERIDWVAERGWIPPQAAALSPVWRVFFDGELVSSLMPSLLYWARTIQLDVYDPQLEVYFAWQDPNGLDKIADPLGSHSAPEADAQAALPPVAVKLWASKVAAVPGSAAEAAALVAALEGKTLKGRRFYQAAGQALWNEVALALPSLRAALQAFERDPGDWGDDMDAPCPAIWSLGVVPSVWPTVWPLLCSLAERRQLCVYVPPPHGLFFAPGLPGPAAAPVAPETGVGSAAAPAPRPATSLQPPSAPAADPRAAPPTGGARLVVSKPPPEMFAAAIATVFAADPVTPMINVLADALADEGFRRQGEGRLEKRYPSGYLGLWVDARRLPDGTTGVRVYLTATLRDTQRVLKELQSEGRLKGVEVQAGVPSLMAELLHYHRLTTPGAANEPRDPAADDWTLVVRRPEEIQPLLEREVLPAIRQVLAEPKPWFLDPPDLMASLKKAVGESGFPAGLLVMNMEDLILARLCGMTGFDRYVADRTTMARESPGVSRASPDSIRRMTAALKAHVPVDAELSKAFAGHSSGGGSPLARAGWAFFLGPVAGLLAMSAGLPDGVMVATVLIGLVYVAWQLFRVGGQSGWRFALPLTVLFPPLALLTIIVLGLRRR